MIVPDVNVLLHAHRSDSPDHVVCRQALEKLLASSASFGLSPLVLSRFVRVATHPRVFDPPDTLEQALAFCDFLLGQPQAIVLRPGRRHWELFSQMCLRANARGNLVADAYHAALVVEQGGEWLTLVRDFARFAELRWRTPDSL